MATDKPTAWEALDGFETVDLVCRAIRQETLDAKSYTFATSDDRALPFLPGQFLNFTFRIGGEEVVRSYSIASSAAHRSRITITVKRVRDGRVSNWLFEHLRVGDHVRAEGPMGLFTADGIEGPIAFISAGSGITPIASMIRSYADLCEDRDVAVLHFSRTPEDMIFAAEFSHWARNLPNARVIPIATQPARGSGWTGPSGRINPMLVAALIPDLRSRTVFTCGPDGFMATVQTIAEGLGVAKERIFQERFTAVSVDAEEGPSERQYDIAFTKSGKSVSCGEQMTVLKAAQSAKINIPTSCGQGICGTCRVKLLSGTVEMKHGGGIKQREIDQGFILACCSRPTSALSIER